MNRAIPDLPRGLWAAMHALAPEPDRFAALLRTHHLLPIAANDPSLDPELGGAVRSAWEQTRAIDDARSAALDVELDELTALLDPADYILIKGAAFRRTIYPDRTLRSMHDIDVVVRIEKAASIVRLLTANGYVPAPGRHDNYVKPPRNLLVELIPRFTQETRHALDYDEIFRERTRGPLGAPHPADHHALATHALLIGTTLHVHARKFVDLWLLSRDPEVFERAVDTAARWQMRRVFHAAMCLLARIFPDAGVDALKERSARTLTRSERGFVERIATPRTPLGPDGFRPLLLARRLALLDSNRIRARFVGSFVRER